jgi:hypothetical protein
MREEIAACSKRAAAVPISSSSMDTWVAAVRQQEREVSRTSTREVQRDGADELATGCMERLTMLRF